MSDDKKSMSVSHFKQEMHVSPFSSQDQFNLSLRMAQALSNAKKLVPREYQGPEGVANCLIAIEMASRVGISPLMVIQNLYVVNGRPGWSSAYIIAQINTSPLFSGRLKFDYTKDKQGKIISATAWIKDREGDRIEGDEITVTMAKAEGWWDKTGSKWPNMTKQMLSYRAAAFFARLHCPELLIGLMTADEIQDVSWEAVPEAVGQDTVSKVNEMVAQKLAEEEAKKKEEESKPKEEEPTKEETVEEVSEPGERGGEYMVKAYNAYVESIKEGEYLTIEEWAKTLPEKEASNEKGGEAAPAENSEHDDAV